MSDQGCAICGEQLKYSTPLTGYRAVHVLCYERTTGQPIGYVDFWREELIAKAEQWNMNTNAARWKVAHIAAAIVGRYEVGATLALANRLKISVQQVQNYAAASKLFTELVREARAEHKIGLLAEIKRLSRTLGISHWYTVATLRRKHNDEGHFTIALAYNYLSEADEFDAPVDRLRSMIENEHGEPSPAPLNLSGAQPAASAPVSAPSHGTSAPASAGAAEAVLDRVTYRGRVVDMDAETRRITVELDDDQMLPIGASITVVYDD